MPTTHYEFELIAIDVTSDEPPEFNGGYSIYSVSASDLNRVKYALNGETPEFDCYLYQVNKKLREFAEAVLAEMDPPVSFGQIVVNNSEPVDGGTAWDPVTSRILHPSQNRVVNICVSVTGTPGSELWRQLAFRADQVQP